MYEWAMLVLIIRMAKVGNCSSIVLWVPARCDCETGGECGLISQLKDVIKRESDIRRIFRVDQATAHSTKPPRVYKTGRRV